MSWRPCGDTVILEKVKEDSLIDLPENREFRQEDIFEVKDVGIGYVTEQGVIVPVEVKIGDKVIIKGKVLNMTIKGERLLMARAQDIIAYERE